MTSTNAFTDADEAFKLLAAFEAFAATAEGRVAARVRHLRGLAPISPYRFRKQKHV